MACLFGAPQQLCPAADAAGLETAQGGDRIDQLQTDIAGEVAEQGEGVAHHRFLLLFADRGGDAGLARILVLADPLMSVVGELDQAVGAVDGLCPYSAVNS